MELRVDVRKEYPGIRIAARFTASGPRVGIFGPSGSGKSTVVRMIAGLVTPDEGEIMLDGTPLFVAGGPNLPPERRRIGLVSQDPNLFPHLGVRENLLYGYRRAPAGERRIELDSLTGVLGIAHLLERGVNNLSGGEKQRIALGRAVLANPRLLLLDEPLSALDDALRFQIIPYLRAVSDTFGIPSLFISHSLVEMRLLAQRVVVMEQGSVAAETDAETLARWRMESSAVGYINLLDLRDPVEQGNLHACAWGENRLLLATGDEIRPGLFQLSSRDIILVRKHPEAISARNLLCCTVAQTFPAGRRVGVELACGGETLVAEIATSAAEELGIAPGVELYAAIKASAFRRLGEEPVSRRIGAPPSPRQ